MKTIKHTDLMEGFSQCLAEAKAWDADAEIAGIDTRWEAHGSPAVVVTYYSKRLDETRRYIIYRDGTIVELAD